MGPHGCRNRRQVGHKLREPWVRSDDRASGITMTRSNSRLRYVIRSSPLG